jgi:UDP-glucose 4-epimerase
VLVKVLVTGGAGFIGSTIASACIDAGHVPIILDDFSTGARAFTMNRIAYEGDVGDSRLLSRIVREHPDLDVVIHCAASIVVPESVTAPVSYYRNNVAKAIDMIEALQFLGLRRVVFSSSASIYVAGRDFTVDETSPIDPTSPYAATKAIVERILRDVCATGELRALSLRYFNPVGADPQRRTGLQLARPSHALGKLIEAYQTDTPFMITGVDWPTCDGTAIRDYIHVWDLARAHVQALCLFDGILDPVANYDVINVGTGYGTTVRQLITAFETVIGGPLSVVEGARRPGDVIGSFTRNEKARSLLQWNSTFDLLQGIRDALEWSEMRESVLTPT